MEAAHTSQWSGRASSRAWEILDLPKKATLIRVRWPFTIVCAYLLLYSERAAVGTAAVHGFVLLYLASNLALYFVDEAFFESFYFFGLLLAFDTVLFTASLAMSGQASPDFYVVCFATIFLCCICRDLGGLIGVAVLSTALYGYFLLSSASVFEPSVSLRIVFPFVISLFYGYFAQVEYLQKRFRAQRELAASTAALLEAVKHQAAEKAALKQELEKKTELLEQANRVREHFLGVMSHELRTPVNVVMGYARLLKDRVLGDVNPTQAEAAVKIMGRAREQLAMISDMLEIASMEAGESIARAQEVGLTALLDDLKSGSELPEGKNIALVWDYPAD
ncbi:MAG TPA: histidine kinase dimerization/phospho-acceptor domain-containing protein, partial [Candidatus Binatia bacterium]